MKYFHRFFLSFIVSINLIATVSAVKTADLERVLSHWAPPQRIPGLMDTAQDQFPVFMSDNTGTVNIFHSQWVGDELSIVYSRWEEGVGWTDPVDLLTSPRQQIRLVAGALSEMGEMNLIFWGGDAASADLFITHAPAESIGDSKAWEKPAIIGPDAISPQSAALVSNESGLLVVVYSGDLHGNGLYNIISTDGGKTWSAPVPIFLTMSERLWPFALKMVLSENGEVHAVWSLNKEDGLSEAIYYARMESNLEKWSEPVILAKAIEYEAATPSIIEYRDSLFVIYHNGFPTTRWMRRSDEAGRSWSEPTRLFKQAGSNGAAALVKDGSNQLQMFFGNRLSGQPDIHGIWHSVWLGNQWSIPEAIVSGPIVLAGPNGEEGFDPSYAQALFYRENYLFLVWRHDSVAGPKNVWYTYQTLKNQHLKTEVESTLIPSLTPDISSAVLQTATPDMLATATIQPGVPIQQQDTRVESAIAASIIPVLVVITTLIFLTRRKK